MNAQAETIATADSKFSEQRLATANSRSESVSLSGDFLEQLRFKGGKLVRHQEFIHAINGVNLDIKRGEALCVVGESGQEVHRGAHGHGADFPSEGEIRYDGQRIDDLSSKQLLPYRKRMQMIFQNLRVAEPTHDHSADAGRATAASPPDWKRQQILDKVEEVMRSVGITQTGASAGHEFSGGQRQRIAIARALAVDPGIYRG